MSLPNVLLSQQGSWNLRKQSFPFAYAPRHEDIESSEENLQTIWISAIYEHDERQTPATLSRVYIRQEVKWTREHDWKY
jgi:hypothetical protein